MASSFLGSLHSMEGWLRVHRNVGFPPDMEAAAALLPPTPRGSKQLSGTGTQESLDPGPIPLVPVQPWAAHLNFPCLSFSIWKAGITAVLTSKAFMNTKWSYKMLGVAPGTRRALRGCQLFVITAPAAKPARLAPTPG